MADDRDRNRTRPDSSEPLDESDIAEERMGKNRLQGDDQANVRNQRQARPDERGETDSVTDSFEKLDKDVRARRDLGKGNRGERSDS